VQALEERWIGTRSSCGSTSKGYVNGLCTVYSDVYESVVPYVSFERETGQRSLPLDPSWQD